MMETTLIQKIFNEDNWQVESNKTLVRAAARFMSALNSFGAEDMIESVVIRDVWIALQRSMTLEGENPDNIGFASLRLLED